jgi:hypothetical protein
MTTTEAKAEIVEMGNLCVWCREDTSFGSGKFVNRIPVATDVGSLPYHIFWEDDSTPVEGYGCEECYADDITNLEEEN